MESPSPASKDSCVICGKLARVRLDNVPYCLDCFNHLQDQRAGVESPTNDNYNIIAFDPEGKVVEFSLERFSLGTRSIWTAIEMVPEDDPRRKWGYVGRRVSISADTCFETQEQALDALTHKVQHLVGHASMTAERIQPYEAWETTARRENEVLYANNSGMATIDDSDEYGYCVVVDGQRFSPEQFLDLLSSYVGFDLYWQIPDSCDQPPAWFQ